MEPSHYVCDDMQWNGTSNSLGSKGLFIYFDMHFRGGGGHPIAHIGSHRGGGSQLSSHITVTGGGG